MLTQTLSVVIPVFQAGEGLRTTVSELITTSLEVAPGVELAIDEIILVCDNPDLPAQERDSLAAIAGIDGRVRIIWLAANFGQHPATVAGIVSTNGDWVATMDEDGQHDPAAIREMALTGARSGRTLTYASPSNPPPHGPIRNAASRLTKVVFRRLTGATGEFHSFRFVEGEIARAACAYVGESVYLDVALRWSCGEAARVPVTMRGESSVSSYGMRKLLSHFWRMVISSGTRPLRMVAALGFAIALSGVATAAVFTYRRLTGQILEGGWTSVMVALLVLGGGLFLSLAVLAEYVGFAVRNSIGKPVYVIAQAPETRALRRLQVAVEASGG